MTKRQNPILRVILRGPGLRSGRIPVPDLIKLCEEAQNAVIRQAEAIEGRKSNHPGPTTNAIKDGCTLELIGIKKGSTVLEFGLATPQLQLTDMKTLGGDAIAELTNTIKILGNGASAKKKRTVVSDLPEGVLHGIIGLSRLSQMKGITELRLVSPRSGSQSLISAPLTPAVTKAVAIRLSKPRSAIVVIDGYLEMADFKPREQKCRIEPVIGRPINCTFTSEFEDQVDALTRQPVRITGEGKYPPNSDKIEVIAIKNIEPLPSLEVGGANFFSGHSLEELAKMQDVASLNDPSKLAGGFPSDEDIDAFLKDIYENRK